MKRTLTLLAVLVSLNVFGTDTREDRLDKAKDLVNAMQMTKAMDASFDQIVRFSEQMVDAQNLSAEEAAKAKESSKKAMEITFAKVKNIDWVTMFSEIYAEVFTTKELQDLIDFYLSPIGQKMIEKQPQLMQATMQKMQVEMGKIMPDLQRDIQKAIEEAKQEDE
ncbi:MAG: DUF2059 domain-containing protein [Lentisphaeria bacterium]|nr:DUF2059 domain-containing protein [Lentisphaeria bacterium]